MIYSYTRRDLPVGRLKMAKDGACLLFFTMIPPLFAFESLTYMVAI